jgi:hypothetical protein
VKKVVDVGYRNAAAFRTESALVGMVGKRR